MDSIKSAEQVFVAIIALSLAAALIYFFFASKPDAVAEDSAAMPVNARRILVWYLILLGVGLIYVIAHVGSADSPDAGLSAEVASQTEKPKDLAAPVLDRVYPQTNPADTTVVDFALFGRNFTKESKVCFNNQERTPVLIGSQRLQTRLEQANIIGLEPLYVFVVNPQPPGPNPPPAPASNAVSPCADPGANTPSNTLGIVVRKARAEVSLFGAKVWMSRELQLLLLAIFAGALGSYVHAVKSLTDFIGNRTLSASWFWWYVTRPFLGAAMALMFYALLRGGFLAGTPADAKAVSPFGVIAVCALVGMFADKAGQKLGEIFDTLFTAKDPRSGKLSAPAIDRLDPDHVAAGTKTSAVLKIHGERLGKVNKVMFDKQERIPDNVSDQQITVTIQADDMKRPRDVFVSVVDPDGVSPAAALHVVTDLSIVMPNGTTDEHLPDAIKGQPYQQTFSATGGKPPYRWGLSNIPGFSIDATGKLDGTPSAAGELKITIKLTDNDDVSVSKDFKLKVN